MAWSDDKFEQVVLGVIAAAVVIYLAMYLYLAPFDSSKFTARGLSVILVFGTLFSSLFACTLVVTKPKIWFGQAASYRFFFFVGSGAAAISTLSEAIRLIREISTP